MSRLNTRFLGEYDMFHLSERHRCFLGKTTVIQEEKIENRIKNTYTYVFRQEPYITLSYFNARSTIHRSLQDFVKIYAVDTIKLNCVSVLRLSFVFRQLSHRDERLRPSLFISYGLSHNILNTALKKYFRISMRNIQAMKQREQKIFKIICQVYSYL